ncbi:MAG: cysteine desulfurase [Afipia felis]|nr:cysteine desulfurase [Afipia felis]
MVGAIGRQMAKTRVYLDWNATAPMRSQAKAAMLQAMDLQGNPSSVHAEGRAARKIIEDARANIAKALGARSADVVFTSGGTEANALALTPGLRRNGDVATRLIVSAIEHSSVRSGGRFPVENVHTAPVTPSGVVDVGRLQSLLEKGEPALVSVMLANNETGAIQPIAEIAELVHAAHGILHVDAVQGFGKIDIDINLLGADLLSISAHKIGGPKGTGALILTERLAGFEPLVSAGGQEKGRRGGTENLPGIAAFGAAVAAHLDAGAAATARMQKLRTKLESGLRAVTPEITIFSSEVPRLPNTTLFSAPGMKAETAVIAFDLEGMAVSSGSACSSGKVHASPVLTAMGVDPIKAQGAVRLSLGWDTTEAEVQYLLEAWISLSNVLVKGSDAVA